MNKWTVGFSFLFLLIGSGAQAAPVAGELLCDLNQTQTELSVRVKAGAEVKVYGHEYMSGHRWISNDGLQSVVTDPANLGSVDTIEFTIKTKDQSRKSKVYKFEYKRPWESKAVADCLVTVTKK